MHKKRCPWVTSGDTLYEEYHDKEWGVPVHDDKKHFELLILEGAQAGLSWSTILKRREGYRRAFAGFEPELVAKFDKKKIQDLFQDTGIVRNKLKIISSVENAKLFLQIQKQFGSFDKYVWSFVKGKTIQNKPRTMSDIFHPQEAKALSADLKRRGFKFVGLSIVYSYMQAAGLVNDHLADCFCSKADA